MTDVSSQTLSRTPDRGKRAVGPRATGARRAGGVVAAVGLVAVVSFPSVAANAYQVTVGAELFMNVSLALSLWLLLVTGSLNMGQVAVMAIGAYTTAALSVSLSWPWWLSTLIAVLVAVVAGLILGLITLRLKGVYFFLVTFAFLEATGLFFSNYFTGVFGGQSGLVLTERLPDLTVGPLELDLNSPEGEYLVAAAIAALACYVASRLWRSSAGLVLRALGGSDSLAESVGVSTFRHRLFALAAGSAITGLVGSYYAYRTRIVDSNDFDLSLAVLIVAFVVIGGSSHPIGPILGAVLVTLLNEWLRDLGSLRQLGYGAALVLFMLFVPNGLVGLARSRWRIWRPRDLRRPRARVSSP